MKQIYLFLHRSVALSLPVTYREKKNRRDDQWGTLLQSYNPLTRFLPALSSCLCVLSYIAGSSLPGRETKGHASFTGYASYWWFCSCSGISVISLSLLQSTIRDLRTAACFLWSRQFFIRKFNSRWMANSWMKTRRLVYRKSAANLFPAFNRIQKYSE